MAKKKAAKAPKKATKKTKTARRAPARVGVPRPAKKTKTKKEGAAPKATTKFFGAGQRGLRGEQRKQFHVLLTKEEHEALAKLTHKMQLSAADVFRQLLAKAK